jgi:hypothetical protein
MTGTVVCRWLAAGRATAATGMHCTALKQVQTRHLLQVLGLVLVLV